MRARNQAQLFKTILDIRAVQEAAAQIDVARAEANLRERNAQRNSAHERLEADEAAWARCLSEGRAGLTVAASWAGEVRTSEADLRQAEEGVRLAAEARQSRNETWLVAQARVEAAEALARTSARRARRHAEEIALAELADRTARRGAAR